MGGSKGSADPSGMYEAMASAQAAQEAYSLGEQQLQWTEQVWNQEQPLVDASEQQQLSLGAAEQQSLEQMSAESTAEWDQYQQLYAPLDAQFVGQAENWASPSNIALVTGQAMGSVAEAGQAGMNDAAETLRSYGINPSSPKYAALYTSAQPMLGAAEAAAGTTAAQNLKLQQLGLEGEAINTGQGLVNASEGLTSAGSGAGNVAESGAAGAAGTAQSNLSTGATAMTDPTAWFNAGANNMNTYVNAVNGYNQSQAEYAEAGASEMGGLGSALGAGLGLLTRIAKGGPATKFANGGMVDPQLTPTQGGGATGIPSQPIPPAQWRAATGGGAPAMPPNASWTPPPGGVGSNIGSNLTNAGWTPPPGGIGSSLKSDIASGTSPLGNDVTGGLGANMTNAGWGAPPGGIGSNLPPGGTPGGTVPVHASPSWGERVDDVPAMLTANEFVIPKDVATWIGHKALAGHIDRARKEQQKFSQRDDIGGEPTSGIPQQPTFVSRPQQPGGMGGQGALPTPPSGGFPQGGFPSGGFPQGWGQTG
jgi:hypothetical protein